MILSEIMYQPPWAPNDPEDVGQEFIELHNRGDAAADLNGWKFTRGVDFVFPAATIEPGQYLVVAADPIVFATTYAGVAPHQYISDYGWTGRLSNSGEELKLVDAAGATIDVVVYSDEGDWSFREKVLDLEFPHGTLGNMEGYAWSGLHDGGGRSLELINPALTNNAGQNWAASLVDSGTPGQANTVAAADLAPLIRDVRHSPAIPSSTDTVTVTAKIQDELAAGLSVVLHYRDDGDPAFNTATMFDDGLHGDDAPGDGIYGGQIGSRPDGTIVEFFVEASDTGGLTRSWPRPVDGINQTDEPRGANALYQVDNNFNVNWTPGDQPIFHLIVLADDWNYFQSWADISNRSFKPNGQMNATFISVDGADTKVRYNAGVRNRGNGSRAHDPHNLRINFSHDRDWQGYQGINLNAQKPYAQILGSAVFRYADVPAADGTRVKLLVNGVDRADTGNDMYGSYDWIEAPDSDLVANHWPEDPNGNLYKNNYTLLAGRVSAALRYIDDNPDSYRNEYGKQTNVSDDDFSDLIHMIDVLNNAPDETYLEDVSQVIDVDAWVRFMAVDTLLSNGEGGLVTGLGDDYMMFQGVVDPRFVLVPYDLDTIAIWGGSTTRDIWSYRNTNLPGLHRLLSEPQVEQIYYRTLTELMDTVFAPETINPLIETILGDYVPQSIASVKTFFVNRVANVRGQIEDNPFTVQTGLPAEAGYLKTTEQTVAMSGNAGKTRVQSILVDGQSADWDLGAGTWSIDSDPVTASLTFQQGSAGYAGALDTELREDDAPGVNRGSATTFKVDANSGGKILQGMLRFADIFGTGAGQIAPSSDIASATLTLNVQDVGNQLQLHRMLTTWDESANWTTFGGNGVQTDGVEAAAAADASFTPNSTGKYAVDVTQALKAWQNDPASNFGWAVIPTGTNGVILSSKENNSEANRPQLTVEVVVEPSAGVQLRPGLNRVVAQTFDGENGAGNLLESKTLEIWSDSAPLIDYPQPVLPEPEVAAVKLTVPDSYLSGHPVLVRVEALDDTGNVNRDLWDATATLTADNGINLDVNAITMFNGLGSALVTFTGSGPFNLTATINGQQDSDDLTSLQGSHVTIVSGVLNDPSGTTTWGGVIHVTADVIVPVGHTLSIQPGTLILLDGVASGEDGADIQVRGNVQSLGTEDSPVTFTAFKPAEAWGEIFHNAADLSLYQYTNIHLAGHSTAGGHTDSGPAIRVSGSTIVFEHTNITDNAGKVMQSVSGSDLTFRNSHLARSVMGPEIDDTALLFEDNWITENHGPNDNDGIYIHSQSAGQTVTLRRGVIADMHDDGLDMLRATVLVEDYIFRDMVDKGVSVFGGEMTIDGMILAGNDIGISAKSDTDAVVHLDHATIAGNRLGLQAENKGGDDPDAVIDIFVTNSIVFGNSEWAVYSDYPLDTIHFDDSIVAPSWISDGTHRGVADEIHSGEIWPGDGNDNTDPQFVATGLRDFRLQVGSPAIAAAGDGTNLGYYRDTEIVMPPTGDLAGDTVWRPEMGQIRVTDELVVPAAYTLTILPGTMVFFEEGAGLTVEGRLLAEGTADAPIRFAPEPGATDWDGIHFNGTMLDNRITHAIVAGSTRVDGMIQLSNANLLIDHTTLEDADRRRIRSNDSSLIVRHSTFADFVFAGAPPNNTAEHIWGGGIPEGGHFIIEDNVFGVTPGHNDGIDFNAGHAAAGDPVPQILGNTFLGGGDDALDLEGDFHIEGNVFMHYRKDAEHDAVDSGESNVISAGDGHNVGHHYVVTRNVFYDADHVTLIKDRSFMTFTNNTVVNVNQGPFASTPGAINFHLPGEAANAGEGAYVEASIFTDTPLAFHSLNQGGTITDLVVNGSILPAAEHGYGAGNTDEDPRLADPATADFSLSPGSPALGAGPVGSNRGADVPAGILLSPVAASETYVTGATFNVAGDGVPRHSPQLTYKYRLNGGVWSGEQAPGTPIVLTGLDAGPQVLEVLARNSAGTWQDEADAVTREWSVNTSLSRVLINEVLASNQSAHEHDSAFPDVIELYNDSPTTANLAGWSVSDDPASPAKFVFAAGTTIGSEGYLAFYAENAPAAGATGTYLGFQLNGDGETLYLYDDTQTLVDSVTFGLQVADLSIGRIGADRAWSLSQPTIGEANVGQPTANPDHVLINEWFANGNVVLRDDFIELHNPDTLPVDIAGLYVTDNPVNQKTKHQIVPLSFIGAEGFRALRADSSTAAGHMDFALRSHMEILGLFDTEGGQLDKLYYTPQTEDVSQGRAPDGNGTIEFFTLPTPGVANGTGQIALHDNLRITELMYNPAGSDSREFVELQNTGATELDLTGVRLGGGIDFVFPSMTLGAGEYVVVARDVAAFEAFYGSGTNVVGGYDPTALGNGGDDILLLMPAPYDAAILRFNYNDSWYPSTDGEGASLVINNPLGLRTAWDDAESWHASGAAGGSPGVEDPVPQWPLGSVVINELLAHSDGSVEDWIELHNTTAADIDISGWFLSDDANHLEKFVIPGDPGTPLAPGNTVLPPGGYIAFNEVNHFGLGVDPVDGFALSEHGDKVLLSSSDGTGALGTYRDFVIFDATANGMTLGRHTLSTGETDFVAMAAATFEAANAEPRVGPIVVEEIMYNPVPGGHEYILLRNISDSPVPLYDPAHPENTWILDTGAIDFVFPQDVTVGPGNAVLVTDVDPATYLATRTLPASVQIFGPLANPLSNGGDTAELLMPGTPELTFVPYITVEEVNFGDGPPWPPEPDGTGPALGKLPSELAEYGSDPVNWGLSVPPQVTVNPLTVNNGSPQLTGTAADDRHAVVVVVTVDGVSYPATVNGQNWTLAENTISPALTAGTHEVVVTAFDEAGNVGTDSTADELTVDLFGVVRFDATSNGFVASFSRPVDPADLNLYDIDAEIFGPADVTLVGDVTGLVAGSLVVAGDTITLIAADGRLPADTYTATLRGGAHGFKDLTTGEQLDGNNDGTTGDDFVRVFTIDNVSSVTVSLPSFSRGPGQAVHMPATGEGVPLRLSDADGVDSVELTIRYNPALLSITGASAATGLPGTATVEVDTSVAGEISLTFSSDTPLPAGPAEFVILSAEVPADAAYGDSHVLAVSTPNVNQGEVTATAQQALHLVTFLGDATGDQSYSGLDAQKVARISIDIDGGLEAYPSIDPRIVGDITGNGTLSGLDAHLIARHAVGLPSPWIPPLPEPGPQRLSLPAAPTAPVTEAPVTEATATEPPGAAPSDDAVNAPDVELPTVIDNAIHAFHVEALTSAVEGVARVPSASPVPVPPRSTMRHIGTIDQRSITVDVLFGKSARTSDDETGRFSPDEIDGVFKGLEKFDEVFADSFEFMS